MAHRSELIIAAGALLIFGGAMATAAPQSQSGQQTSAQQASQSQSQNNSGDTTSSQPAQQPVSLGDAARKAREQNKNAHTAKTYSNDDLPTIRSQGISTVGQASETTPATDATPAPGAATKPADDTKSEQYWRKRFADLRTKISDNQKEMDVLQRELNLAQREFYNDPNMALQQQHSRDEINTKTEKIDAKKKQLDDLNQQLSDMQDELRRAGGDPDWGREPSGV
jgi:DNA repair exonuclease SbcCD ATPase subunit